MEDNLYNIGEPIICYDTKDEQSKIVFGAITSVFKSQGDIKYRVLWDDEIKPFEYYEDSISEYKRLLNEQLEKL